MREKQNLRRCSAVIFDMDGLLLDSERIVVDTWRRVEMELAHRMPVDALHQLIGRTAADGEHIVRQHMGPSYPYRQRRGLVMAKVAEQFAAGAVPVKPGVGELLDWLDARSIPRIVATSTKYAEATRRLTLTGLLHRFAGVVGGDQVSRGKPAPDLFLRAAGLLGVEPDKCIVFEDSDAGIRAAQACGMPAVLVPDLKTPSQEIRDLADGILDSLHQAPEFISARLAGADS